MKSLKAHAVTVVLAAVLIMSCITPLMAQGVTVRFTAYVSFFYPFHFLYNLQITVRDQTGRIVGSGMSYDGSMVIIPMRTKTSIISLTVSASGYASGPFTYWVTNPPFWPVSGTSTIPVQSNGGDYWITVNLS